MLKIFDKSQTQVWYMHRLKCNSKQHEFLTIRKTKSESKKYSVHIAIYILT